MLIFGIRRKSYITGHITQTCSHCGATCAQTQMESKRFFTLFFIPIIPLGSTRSLTCTSCGQRTTDNSTTVLTPLAPATPIEKAPSTSCPICGEALESIDDQCAHCGAPIQK
jgi:hypothetical protein